VLATQRFPREGVPLPWMRFATN